MNPATSERRKQSRVTAMFTVKSSTGGLEGSTINFSQNGLCMCVSDTPDSKSPSTIQNLEIYLSRLYPRIKIDARIIWNKRSPDGKLYYGLHFKKQQGQDSQIIKKILAKPKAKFVHPYGAICTKMNGVNLTVGCDFGCVYCHYNEWVKDQFPAYVGSTFNISPFYKLRRLPKIVYLSPYAEPFSSKAKGVTHELMEYLLPKGIHIWILTKAVIPDETIKLIKQYPSQVEVGLGITNLDAERNKRIEPGCPPAKERLTNISKLKKTGCRYGIRMDPLIPLIDDDTETLVKSIKKFSELGVQELVASYLIIPALLLWKLKNMPFLQRSLELFTEKSPTTAGVALSLPLEMKKEKYSEINRICKSYGITFHICGCREQRIKEAEYILTCR